MDLFWLHKKCNAVVIFIGTYSIMIKEGCLNKDAVLFFVSGMKFYEGQ